MDLTSGAVFCFYLFTFQCHTLPKNELPTPTLQSPSLTVWRMVDFHLLSFTKTNNLKFRFNPQIFPLYPPAPSFFIGVRLKQLNLQPQQPQFVLNSLFNQSSILRLLKCFLFLCLAHTHTHKHTYIEESLESSQFC